MGGEKQCSFAEAENFGLQEASKLGGGDGIQTARRFIQQKNARPVNKSPSEAQPLHGAGRKRAHLPVEGFFKMELFRELRDAPGHGTGGKLIQPAEESKIFAAGKTRIKAQVAAGVVAKLAANGARIADRIVSSNLGAAPGGQQQGGEDAEQRGLAGAIRP